MGGAPSSPGAAFGWLEQRLAWRRLRQLDLKLRIELALLALLIGGFLFWQVRIPLVGVAQRHGPVLAAGWVFAALLVLAGLGVALVAQQTARAMRRGPDGPEWLALPVSGRELEGHLRRESGRRAGWILVPAAGLLAASVGLLPGVWIVLEGVWFGLLFVLATRLGGLIGSRHATRSISTGPSVDPLLVLLSRPRTSGSGARWRPARWARSPVWGVLAAKDLLLTSRNPALLRRAAMAAVLGLLSLAAWRLPWALPVRHALGFALLLLSATSLAEWLIALSGRDPFSLLRSLPAAPSTIWGSRMLWAWVALVFLSLGMWLVDPGIAPEAERLYLAWSGAAIVGIVMLGVNYGLTLFPRADLAQRMLMLSLSLAMAASLILPLSGWVVLASGVFHSARRLHRWHRLEELAC